MNQDVSKQEKWICQTNPYNFHLLSHYNYNSYQEIPIFAKQFSDCISNYKSFRIRLFALSTTLVSSDVR